MRNIIQFLVNRPLIVNMISFFLLALGLYAMLEINREAFPNVNLDRIQIDFGYPGASPEEIERLIVTPIEQQLKSTIGIDKMTSTSFPGSGRINLEIDPDASNRLRIVSDVQQAVNQADLPSDLPYDPFVTEIDGSVFPVINLAVSAKRTDLELNRLGRDISDELLQIEGIAKVVIQGQRKAEIRITLDPEKMRKERIATGDVVRVIESWNVNVPGGDLETTDQKFAIRITGELKGAGDAGNLVLRSNERGDALRLKDIASITETLEKPTKLYDVKGQPALAIVILKQTKADIISTVDRIREYIDTIADRHGADITVSTYQDFSRFARLRLGVLTNNGMVGILLVLISLIIFLRPSVAFTTTLGLPIVFSAGLFALLTAGITLNLISMLGFIMVLGMLVDDAIIVGENITWHMEKGKNPIVAAVDGTIEIIGPVTATILTTVVAFGPLMFMEGIIGKFIVAVPIVVISLLFFSWLEAFLILPGHVAHFASPDKHPEERHWITAIENTYLAVLRQAIRFRWITVILALLLLIGSFYLAATRMSFQLFPAAGIDQYTVRVTATAGTRLDIMRKKMIEIDKAIRERTDDMVLETTLISTGQIAVDAGDPLTQRGARFGQISVIYQPAISREGHDVMVDMRQIEKDIPPLFPNLKIAFAELKPGPPAGRALQVEISQGDDADTKKASEQLMDYLKNIDGVTSMESGSQAGDESLHVVVNRSLATYAGIPLSTIASHVRAAVGGLRVATTRRGTEEIDITVRYPAIPAKQREYLENLLISNTREGLIPLKEVATLEEHPGFTTIRHKEGIRVIHVAANIDNDVITSSALNMQVAKDESSWLGKLENKVVVNYGGEEEKNQESVKGLMQSLVFAMLGIFIILAVQFNRLSYPFYVMMAIPFGAIGIIIGFYLHDLYWRPMPLSFFALMGGVALTGVVVNSSLVLLVFVQRAIEQGMNTVDAIMEAGRRRLRAVILTATTTVVGLLPTAYGWGGMDPFVSPMALALSWGLIFSTVITLVVIPAAFAIGRVGKKSKEKKVKEER
jgi:multidrug efflux pump subunit AcrB